MRSQFARRNRPGMRSAIRRLSVRQCGPANWAHRFQRAGIVKAYRFCIGYRSAATSPPYRIRKYASAARSPAQAGASVASASATAPKIPETDPAQSRIARISPSYRWHRPSAHIATNAPESAQETFWARPSFGHRSGRVRVASPSSAAVRLRCGHHRGVSSWRSAWPACWVSFLVIRSGRSTGHRIQVRHGAADRRCRLTLHGLSPTQAP